MDATVSDYTSALNRILKLDNTNPFSKAATIISSFVWGQLEPLILSNLVSLNSRQQGGGVLDIHMQSVEAKTAGNMSR